MVYSSKKSGASLGQLSTQGSLRNQLMMLLCNHGGTHRGANLYLGGARWRLIGLGGVDWW